VKHYLLRINFLIEQVKAGVIQFQFVPSQVNVADIITKPLGPKDFQRLRAGLLRGRE
jgi:hypothetical protein